MAIFWQVLLALIVFAALPLLAYTVRELYRAATLNPNDKKKVRGYEQVPVSRSNKRFRTGEL